MQLQPSRAIWKALPQRTWIEKQKDVFSDAPLGHKVGALVIVLLLASFRLDESVPVFVAGLLVTSLISWQLIVIGTLGKPSKELKKLLEQEGPGGHAVTMTVLKDNVPLGQDSGIAKIDGDRLTFIGLSTSFTVSTADVVVSFDDFANGPLIREKEGKCRFGNLSGKAAWGFELRENRQYRVYFLPMEVKGYPSIYSPLFEWLKREPVALDDTVLPPLEPQPGYKNPLTGISLKKIFSAK